VNKELRMKGCSVHPEIRPFDCCHRHVTLEPFSNSLAKLSLSY
jgi:hypothetical protein